jgi:hypothetical protein
MPNLPRRQRTVHDVIDTAIRENRTGELLSYSFASAFVILGGFVILWSITHNVRLMVCYWCRVERTFPAWHNLSQAYAQTKSHDSTDGVAPYTSGDSR